MIDKKLAINYDLLPFEKFARFKELEKGEPLDFHNFIENNFVTTKNRMMKTIEKRGGALWLGHNGLIYFRVAIDEDIYCFESIATAGRAVASFLNVNEIFLFKDNGEKKERFKPADIALNDLISVADRFTPFTRSEFYIIGNNWFRTSFVPSIYLTHNYEVNSMEPITIFKLIKNLVNNNEEYNQWVLNWLACFFQTLKKSQVALVLRGDQGSGKGIFFTRVITKLFGERYCVPVSSDNLESAFKNWIEGRLFLNLNEVAADMKARRNVKNFIKQLVTDETVNVEIKHKDASEVKVFANVLITSNEVFPLEVEPSDRRYTVIATGKSLKAQKINIDSFLNNIEQELSSFATYLHNYKCDFVKYNQALDTPEKRAIVAGTNSQSLMFINAIKEKNLEFFADMAEDSLAGKEYLNITSAIKNSYIYQPDLLDIYQKLFETQKNKKRIMDELRRLEPAIFGADKVKKDSNGRRFFAI